MQIAVDGIFGPETYKATAEFQKANALVADGLVGSSTLAVAKVVYGYGEQASAAATPATPKATPQQELPSSHPAAQLATPPTSAASTPVPGAPVATATKPAVPAGQLDPTFPLMK